jgi:hypothetical protein
MRIEGAFGLKDIPAHRSLVPLDGPGGEIVALDTARRPNRNSPLSRLVEGTNVHSMTPRQMANLSMDLYIGGYLQWEEYAMIAFQPELHPDFNRTIGALTGETSAPDRPRDYVSEWEERYAFERRHNGEDPGRLQSTLRILALLKKIEDPTDLLA